MASSEGKKEASASFFVFGFGKDSRMLQKEEGLVASEEGEEFRCVLLRRIVMTTKFKVTTPRVEKKYITG